MRLLVAGILVIMVLAGCTQPGQNGDDDADPPPAMGDPVRFLAIGDMGTGDQPQLDVAAAMGTVCDDLGCDFVIGMGDNIYEVGVTSPYDPQFITKFEQPYADFDIPFYMTLGNHDNAGVRGAHATGDFQVDYAARDDRLHDIFQMPDRWYTHQHGDVLFVAMDTNIVFDNNSAAPPQTASALSDDVNGVQQAEFIDDAIATSNASWVITHGHHPIYSNGDHGNFGAPWSYWLRDRICRNPVDLAFAGHDHDMQWLQSKEAGCGDTEFLVSGAAAKIRDIGRDYNDAHFTCGDTLGFFWGEIHGDVFTGRFYDSSATLLYERTVDRSDRGSLVQTLTDEGKACFERSP